MSPHLDFYYYYSNYSGCSDCRLKAVSPAPSLRSAALSSPAYSLDTYSLST